MVVDCFDWLNCLFLLRLAGPRSRRLAGQLG